MDRFLKMPCTKSAKTPAALVHFLHRKLMPPRASSPPQSRDGSGTTGALPRSRQSRHDPQQARRLTLAGHHRLFILRPRRLTSMPGPVPTGRHARCESGVHTQWHAERPGEHDPRPLPGTGGRISVWNTDAVIQESKHIFTPPPDVNGTWTKD